MLLKGILVTNFLDFSSGFNQYGTDLVMVCANEAFYALITTGSVG